MPYFTHDPQRPLLTVMLPTRGRFDLCKNTIDSFADTCSQKSNVEIILKFDFDDVASYSRLAELRQDIKIKAIISDRRNGYHSLHEYCDEMMGIATGTWLLFMNDDSKMATMNWDLQILEAMPHQGFKGNPEFGCLNPNGAPEFPIIRTDVCKKIGHFALHNHVDSYIQDVYGNFDAKMAIPVNIDHFKCYMTDKTADDSNAAAMITSPSYGPFIHSNINQILAMMRAKLSL